VVDLSGQTPAFLVGALVGAAIHLGGALWYTRRQALKFRAEVRSLLFAPDGKGAVTRIVDAIEKSIPRIQGSIGAARREAARELKLGEEDDPETSLEIEDLAGAVGKKNAQRLLTAEKVLHKFRARRQAKAAQGTASGAPAAPAAGATPGQIHPSIVAALEKAGFKRDAGPPVADGSSGSPEATGA
jgi:hypothetical protein